MSRSREELRSFLAQAISKYRKQPPTPLYQKVVVWVLGLGALVGLLGFLFFR